MVAVEYFGYTDKKGKSRIGRRELGKLESKPLKLTATEKKKRFYVVEHKEKLLFGGTSTMTSLPLSLNEAKRRAKELKKYYYPRSFERKSVYIRKANKWEKESAIASKRRLKEVI